MIYITVPLVVSFLIMPHWADDMIEDCIRDAARALVASSTTSLALWMTNSITPVVEMPEPYSTAWWFKIGLAIGICGILMLPTVIVKLRAWRAKQRVTQNENPGGGNGEGRQ